MPAEGTLLWQDGLFVILARNVDDVLNCFGLPARIKGSKLQAVTGMLLSEGFKSTDLPRFTGNRDGERVQALASSGADG